MDVLMSIEERYGLGPVRARGRLEGGYANDVTLIEAAGQRYVLRMKHPPVIHESLAWEHELLDRVDLDIVPKPISARDGSTFFVRDGLAVSLLPFVPGRPAETSEGPAVAAALGRFHAAAASLELPQRPSVDALAEIEWPPARLPPRLERHLPALEAAREWAIRQTRERAEPVAPIHGDFFPGNVLVDAGRVTALLDWEEARLDWTEIDVAAGVWHFADIDAPERFLAAYEEAGGPAVDGALLTPLIRVKRVLEALRAPTDRHVDWDYQRENLRAIELLPES